MGVTTGQKCVKNYVPSKLLQNNVKCAGNKFCVIKQ